MDNPHTDEMTFLEHLEEMRWRIMKALLAIVVIAIIAYIRIDLVLAFLTQPVYALDVDVQLQAIRVSDLFMVQLIASLLAGLVLASPIVIYQLWRFISPALTSPSRGLGLIVVLASTLFFIFGVTFGYMILLPFSLRFFTALGSDLVASNYSIQAYMGYVAWMLLSTGLVFQLPVVAFILTKIGLLTPAFLRHYRKYSIVGILIFSAVLTPPDPLSQLMMAGPLMLLYELSVLISRVFSPAVES